MTRPGRDRPSGTTADRKRTTTRRGLVAGAATLAAVGALPTAWPATAQERSADEEAALAFLLTLERRSVSFYRTGLGRFDAAAFAAAGLPEGAYPTLVAIRDQEEAHVVALAEIVGDGGNDAGEPGASDGGDDVDAFLAAAAALKSAAVAAYAGAAPAIETRRTLRAVLGIHSVEARHAATLNALVGRPPFPDAIDAPLGRSAVREAFDRAPAAGGTPADGEGAAGTPEVALDDPRFAGVVADAASRLGVPEGELRAVRVEAREWSDASLGCPRPAGGYAQVLTPGYLLVVGGGGRELEYHTDETGAFVSC